MFTFALQLLYITTTPPQYITKEAGMYIVLHRTGREADNDRRLER